MRKFSGFSYILTDTNYAMKKLVAVLLWFMIAPAAFCAFFLLDPPGFAADCQVAFRAICGVGLVVSIVIVAVLYLWLDDKLGLK
jgi:uncharacterized membrane protein YciS (DUF1049 family)